MRTCYHELPGTADEMLRELSGKSVAGERARHKCCCWVPEIRPCTLVMSVTWASLANVPAGGFFEEGLCEKLQSEHDVPVYAKRSISRLVL